MKEQRTKGHCELCGAEVLRLIDKSGATVVLDAQPAPLGDYSIVRLDSGLALAQQDGEQWDLFGECDGKKYQLHHRVCPVTR